MQIRIKEFGKLCDTSLMRQENKLIGFILFLLLCKYDRQKLCVKILFNSVLEERLLYFLFLAILYSKIYYVYYKYILMCHPMNSSISYEISLHN